MKEQKVNKEKVSPRNLSIHFIRHAHKDSTGMLSQEGILAASNFAFNPKYASNPLIVTSNIQRAEDTGTIIANNFHENISVKVTPLLSEAPYTDEKISELELNGGKWLLINKEGGKLPSTKVMAGKIAYFILEQLTNHSDSKNEELIAVSHIPPMMCFIGYLLAFNDNVDFINESIRQKLQGYFESGFFTPLEGFLVNFDQNNRMSFGVTFKDIHLQVNMETLIDLAEYYLNI